VTDFVPDRLTWAVEHLDVEPHHNVLEVGGAPGTAAALICDRLTSGWLLEVDRSERGAARIEHNNRDCVASGTLEVRTSSLADLDGVGDRRFDRVLAVNVNVFWTSPAQRECDVLARLLKSNGKAMLAYSAPSSHESRLIRVEAALTAAGFVGIERIHGATAAAVVARPPSAGPAARDLENP
jgi:cyclopropane fatty-acyl-phospholipid synthase-like methyltransferase